MMIFDSTKTAAILRFSALAVPVCTLVGVFGALLAVSIGLHPGENLVSTINFLNLKDWFLLVFVCALEEVVFRGMLSLSKRAIATSLSVILFMTLIALSHSYFGILYKHGAIHFITVSACFLLAFVSGYFLYKHAAQKISTALAKKYNLFFWISCLIFAMAHISNYPDRKGWLIFFMILVLPQFCFGAIAGIVRIRYGIYSSIAMHFIFDAWVFSLATEKHIGSHLWSVVLGVILFIFFAFGLFEFRLLRRTLGELRNPHRVWCRAATNSTCNTTEVSTPA